MENKSPNTEIDLLEVFAKFFSVILKNKILIVTCAILGLLSGYLLSVLQKPKWEASLMISTTLLSQQEAEFLINEFIESGDAKSFEDRKNVIDLHQTIYDDKDSENLFLQLTATTDSRDAFSGLQKELINYINSSEPVLRKTKERKIYFSELINKITQELESLEKLKTKMVNQANISTFTPSDLSVKSVELYENKIQYQQALKDLDSVSFLVKGFDPVGSAKPVNLFLALGTGLGLFLAVCIVIIKIFIPHYRQYINTQG